MAIQSGTALAALSLLWASALSIPATAQQPAAAAASSSPAGPATTRWEGITVTALNGQSPVQLGQDRYECHRWAVSQTGFDPTTPGGSVSPSANPSRRRDYRRAMTACLRARGYAVRSAASPYPYAPSPVPPPPYVRPYNPPVPIRQYPPAPAPRNPPLSAQVEAGVSFAAGNTSDYLDDGVSFGLGLTWFPNPTMPLALKVDGNYSWFGTGNGGFYGNDGGYTHGNVQLYGGDIDLEVNLDHRWGSRVYLLGGLGEYRTTTYLRHGSPGGLGCGYFCGPLIPGASYLDDHTTDWHGSWNAGIGWEWAVGPSSFLFVEARYMQVLTSDTRLQFVPVRVGFRF